MASCTRCGADKPLTDEFWYRQSVRTYYRRDCKDCVRARVEERRQELGPEAIRSKSRRHTDRRQRLLADLKAKPCADCGGEFPSFVMEFDHVRGEKVANVANIYQGSLKNLLVEIEKCDLVCANCHRYRTWERKQWVA